MLSLTRSCSQRSQLWFLVRTNFFFPEPPKIIGLHAKFVETDSVTLAWEVSIFEEDFSYEITISDYYEDKLMTRFNVTNTNSHRIGNLLQDKDYVVQVQLMLLHIQYIC